ncbi:unnamed protein product [Rotaria sp. Silwood1]|nr:unnamed protein product [Rotaria sp. Silwood1]CAF3724783.1 unnamed protein product [Rotaria sp. Silwood1]CAF5032159.1 unnamed protein product [Rotaria sp. Silwood1]
MSEVILQNDYDVSQVSPDVCVLSPGSALSSASSDSFPAPLQSIDNIRKAMRDKFHANLKSLKKLVW